MWFFIKIIFCLFPENLVFILLIFDPLFTVIFPLFIISEYDNLASIFPLIIPLFSNLVSSILILMSSASIFDCLSIVILALDSVLFI